MVNHKKDSTEKTKEAKKSITTTKSFAIAARTTAKRSTGSNWRRL